MSRGVLTVDGPNASMWVWLLARRALVIAWSESPQAAQSCLFAPAVFDAPASRLARL